MSGVGWGVRRPRGCQENALGREDEGGASEAHAQVAGPVGGPAVSGTRGSISCRFLRNSRLA